MIKKQMYKSIEITSTQKYKNYVNSLHNKYHKLKKPVPFSADVNRRFHKRVEACPNFARFSSLRPDLSGLFHALLSIFY